MTHGIMFHYFHDEEVPKTQGSISGKVFEQVLDKYNKDYQLLSAEEYYKKAVKHTLKEKDVCITFDDGLYSQYHVADKILQRKGLTAFYFVYTSPMEGKLEKMELYRTFRNKYCTMDDFYDDFFETLIDYGNQVGIDYKLIMTSDSAENYYLQYEYYTKKDRLFRYFRNEILAEKYDLIMNMLMTRKDFIPEKECKNIWIEADKLVEMEQRGNIIGLHSHTHPVSLRGLLYDDKYREYSTNKQFLEKIIRGGGKSSIVSV